MMGAAGTPEIVTQTLAGMGFAGAVITVLLSTIAALVTGLVVIFRINNRLHAERKMELATFSKLVEANNAALTKVAESTEERNKVTEALAEAIRVQATAFEMVNQRIEFYHNGNIEKLKDVALAIGSQAEAVRVNTGMVTDARNGVQSSFNTVVEMKAMLAQVAVKLDGMVSRRGR
ncbi:hypothetical protein SAMN05444164_0768 [Bradyrhizobium erythrophlei]|uniref:Uncharacterized protein n=2 Tax=Bradyrhizobium erythrophlei TaxID=1437360 RepID=A0A1H4NYU3_9BRAD|nr:hypothetical protein SAMN05444164_0768 [Bradyrhizobium erythrophlei]